jgi:hypothetical protein
MLESAETAVAAEEIGERIRGAGPGLLALLAQARETWSARAREGQPGAVGAPGAGWRPFEDAFPTFYQFTNKPR